MTEYEEIFYNTCFILTDKITPLNQVISKQQRPASLTININRTLLA